MGFVREEGDLSWEDLQKLELLEGLLASWATGGIAVPTAKDLHEPNTTVLSIDALKQEQGYTTDNLRATFGSLADLPQSLNTLINQLEA